MALTSAANGCGLRLPVMIMLVRSIGRAGLLSPNGISRRDVFITRTRAGGGPAGLPINSAMTCPRSFQPGKALDCWLHSTHGGAAEDGLSLCIGSMLLRAASYLIFIDRTSTRRRFWHFEPC